jgi:hypothetical protein
VAGVVWVHCLPVGLREQLAERLAPLLGMLAGLFELALDYTIAAWDWARSKFAGVYYLGWMGSRLASLSWLLCSCT